MASGSISGWGEGILLSLAFIVVLGAIIVQFDGLYGRTDQPLTILQGANETTSKFISVTNTAQNDTINGETITTAYGVQPKNSLGIVRDFVSVTWDVLNGNWLTQIGDMIGGGSITVLFMFLRILFVASLIFAVLYAVFKVVV